MVVPSMCTGTYTTCVQVHLPRVCWSIYHVHPMCPQCILGSDHSEHSEQWVHYCAVLAYLSLLLPLHRLEASLKGCLWICFKCLHD